MKLLEYTVTMLMVVPISQAVAQEAEKDSVKELYRRIEILAEELEALRLSEIGISEKELVHGLGPAAGRIYQAKKLGP